MRKLFILSGVGILTIYSLRAQDARQKANLELKVDLTSIKYPLSKIYLSYYNSTTKERFSDSADAKTSRSIVFKTYLNEPILAQLRVLPDQKADTSKKARSIAARDIYSIYLEPGKIQVLAKDSLSASTVKGSATQADFQALKDQSAAYDSNFNTLYAQYREARIKKDNAAADVAEKAMDSLEQVVNNKVYLPYIKSKGKTSAVGLYALSQYSGYVIDADKTAPLFDQLSDAVKNLPAGKAFNERIELAKKTGIGQYAIPFTQKDTAGTDVTLASFKGKYVLLDFWASWCGPCRAENPNVVKVFNQYKDKGFTVLGISLDQPGAKEKWMKAIHDDMLTWTQVSDLKFWNNDVAKLYGVQAIPQNFLLDADGKIIGKNLRGEELQKTLDGIFAAKTTGSN